MEYIIPNFNIINNRPHRTFWKFPQKKNMLQFNSYFLDDEPSARVFDVFEPEHLTHSLALFFIHGGGWSAGGRAGAHAIMRALNKQGYLCASTDYRLVSPAITSKITAFDQLKDVRESYDAFVALAQKRIPNMKVAVFGSSAGAHLASLVATAAPGECGEKVNLTQPWLAPAAAVLQSTPVSFEPWPDIFPHIWVSMQKAAGALYENNPEPFRALSLCQYVRKNNPPLLFLEAANEHMFPSEMTLEIVKKHQEWGIPSEWHRFETAEHGFFYNVTRRPQKEAFEITLAFLDKIEHL